MTYQPSPYDRSLLERLTGELKDYAHRSPRSKAELSAWIVGIGAALTHSSSLPKQYQRDQTADWIEDSLIEYLEAHYPTSL